LSSVRGNENGELKVTLYGVLSKSFCIDSDLAEELILFFKKF
jgi:hypothetical protein